MQASKAVHKYALEGALSDVDLPRGAKVIHAAVQNGIMYIWALISPSVLATKKRTFLIASTGFTFRHRVAHITTMQEKGIVMHVFELLP